MSHRKTSRLQRTGRDARGHHRARHPPPLQAIASIREAKGAVESVYYEAINLPGLFSDPLPVAQTREICRACCAPSKRSRRDMPARARRPDRPPGRAGANPTRCGKPSSFERLARWETVLAVGPRYPRTSRSYLRPNAVNSFMVGAPARPTSSTSSKTPNDFGADSRNFCCRETRRSVGACRDFPCQAIGDSLFSFLRLSAAWPARGNCLKSLKSRTLVSPYNSD